jgi:hypothetical protein
MIVLVASRGPCVATGIGRATGNCYGSIGAFGDDNVQTCAGGGAIVDAHVSNIDETDKISRKSDNLILQGRGLRK